MLITRSTTSLRNLPLNLNILDKVLFKHEIKKELSAINSINLKKITLFPDLRIKGDFHSELKSYDFCKNNFQLSLFLKDLRKKKIYIQNSIYITNSWSTNYFHWFCDILPKLQWIDKKLQEYTVVLPKQLSKISFIKESLKAYPNIKIIWQTAYQKIKIQNFHFIPNLAPTGNYNDEYIKKISNHLRTFFNLDSINPTDNTFISRQNESYRKIINWKDIEPLLHSSKIKSVSFEKLQWTEQIKVAAQSKILIGVHGAGLTNMLFMKSGSTIIELRKKGDAHNNCYFSLASALKHQYYYILCDVDNMAEITQKNNFYLSAISLKKTLNTALNTL